MIDNSVDSLKNLGLTVTQAKIYLSILKTDNPTAKNISQSSGIAREAVYHTLPSLESIGLITRKLGSPITFKASDPKIAVSILLERKKTEYLEINEKANQALKGLSSFINLSDKITDNDNILFSTSKLQPTKELIQALKKTKQTVEFTTRYNLFVHAFNDIQLRDWISEMHRAVQRGIKFRMLIDNPSGKKLVPEVVFDIPKSNSLLRNKNFEYRYTQVPPECIIINFDKDNCLIETSKDCDIDISPFIWTNNQALITLSKTYFESHWNSAEKPVNQQLSNSCYL
jgi:sugar-specific transcriptional regulator TrmB